MGDIGKKGGEWRIPVDVCNTVLISTCDLVSIIPPRHDRGVVRSVLSKPEVSLTEIIKNVTRPAV